ncbi:Por secretion system C-terminal sorting domain-containing protein [Pontibacter akesuensis]|uniref:Por secretion system C-terminal sorting domain-containing protein n=2 Tax=Pontibacter akesuensis TaxID=388950 RepID=A0A1I7KIV3_9BACT|nr:Por secretion system C-terminal sorting domain-containing protein [Pontibacter akesuensis]
MRAFMPSPLRQAFLFIFFFAASVANALAAVPSAKHVFTMSPSPVAFASGVYDEGFKSVYMEKELLPDFSVVQETQLNSFEAPQEITARASFVKAIVVRWQPVQGANNYIIEKSTSGTEGSFFILTTVSGNQSSYKETDLGLSQTVHYRIKAVAADGSESLYSSVVSATTNPDEIIRIMPLGDSNTQGNIVPDKSRQVAYRKALYDNLAEAQIKFRFVGSEKSGEALLGTDTTKTSHAGFGGARNQDIVLLLRNGEFPFYGNINDMRGPGGNIPYLDRYHPDIVLLHIGTNPNNASSNAVEDLARILDEIDAYETAAGKEVTVVLPKVILTLDKESTHEAYLKTYNLKVRSLAEERILAGDQIILADMEKGAGIDYRKTSDGGDMADNLHPNPTGYAKMAQVWYDAIAPISVLPVEFISFDATHAQGRVLLKWSTASEDNNSHFEVERMQEGQAFRRVGTVAGAGNSQLRRRYTFQDATAPAGTLYYRLKQVDHDGTYEYSKVVAIQHGRTGEIPSILYPNPSSGEGAVQLNAGGFSPEASVGITLFDAFGRRLQAQSEKAGATGQIHTSVQLPPSLAKGLYIIQIASATRIERLKLLIK